MPPSICTAIKYHPLENGLSPYYLFKNKDKLINFETDKAELLTLIEGKQLWAWEPEVEKSAFQLLDVIIPRIDNVWSLLKVKEHNSLPKYCWDMFSISIMDKSNNLKENLLGIVKILNEVSALNEVSEAAD